LRVIKPEKSSEKSSSLDTGVGCPARLAVLPISLGIVYDPYRKRTQPLKNGYS
jgi:hypothetical protein